MQNYDFIEIGTSDFWTCIEDATDETVGLSIEPIQAYLDNLPDKPNVKKICCAVSFDGAPSKNIIYYIPPEIVEQHNLSFSIKGCNSIGGYHNAHLRRNNEVKHLVQTMEVDMVPLTKIFYDNKVNEVDLLKLDTEGGDCKILNSFIPYLEKHRKLRWPKKIIFETNKITPPKEIQKTIQNYLLLGYNLTSKTRTDTIMELPK